MRWTGEATDLQSVQGIARRAFLRKIWEFWLRARGCHNHAEDSDDQFYLVLCDRVAAGVMRRSHPAALPAWWSAVLMEITQDRPRRKVDTSNADARRAVAATLDKFAGWRSDMARFAVKLERHYTDAERVEMLARCDAIDRELLAARTELLTGLADAPQRIAGHSRVEDVEKALDGVETMAAELRRRLRG